MKRGATLLLACTFLSMATGTQSQIRLLPGQQLRTLPDNAVPQDPRIADLEARIAAMQSQIAALTARVERTENSAGQASFVAGAATSWIDSHGSALLDHTHSYSDKTVWINHTCENANAGPDHVPCSQITGSQIGTTSEPE